MTIMISLLQDLCEIKNCQEAFISGRVFIQHRKLKHNGRYMNVYRCLWKNLKKENFVNTHYTGI